ncbi:MAG: hypothetical protein KGL52_11670 [Rhodospirillales bacterium]|nr:hypothetical protein [Rhodospirillales bacterium]
MLHLSTTDPALPANPSTLVLADRLIALAKEAERAGLWGTAAQLLELACAVFDEPRKAN